MTAQDNQGPTGGLTPHLQINDNKASEAIEFYKKAFGATEIIRMPAEDGLRLMHAHIHINGSSLMLHDAFPEYVSPEEADGGPPRGVMLHLQVDDVDTWYNRAVDAGVAPIMPPEDMFWGDRYGQVKDPFGHTWSIAAPNRAV
jgi:PhnB protein